MSGGSYLSLPSKFISKSGPSMMLTRFEGLILFAAMNYVVITSPQGLYWLFRVSCFTWLNGKPVLKSNGSGRTLSFELCLSFLALLFAGCINLIDGKNKPMSVSLFCTLKVFRFWVICSDLSSSSNEELFH